MVENTERSRRSALDAAQIERDRTLSAIHGLEEALSLAAGEESWLAELEAGLDALQSAMFEEQRELNRPDSLLAMVSAERPRRFGPRVRGIREQYEDIGRQLESFRRDIDVLENPVRESGELRHRAGWIIRALHNCRNRQADLVFDALGLDLERRDG